jgi:hypothetical protein
MKNPRLISAKQCVSALTISSALCLLAFSGCSSIEGAADNRGVTTSLLMGHPEHGQEKPSNQPANPEPDYEWWY